MSGVAILTAALDIEDQFAESMIITTSIYHRRVLHHRDRGSGAVQAIPDAVLIRNPTGGHVVDWDE